MNIGIDISPLLTSTRTGVGEYTYELLQALFLLDKKNHYFLFYNSFRDVSVYLPKWEGKNIHYISTKYPNKIFHFCLWFFGVPKLDKLIQKKAHVTLNYFFSPNIGFQKISKSCKHILTIHDLSFEIFPEYFSFKMRLWHIFLRVKKQCQSAYKILTPSENTKSDLQHLYTLESKKIQVIIPGLSENFFQPVNEQTVTQVRKKYNLPEKYILFLGTVEPRKNVEGIIEGFKIFQSQSEGKTQEYELIIAGGNGWKNSDILRVIEKTSGVRYIGYVSKEEKPALYKSAKVFVYPSFYEGFGFPILEAMAQGIPVITSGRSSLPEISEGAAYLVDPLNSSEIALGLVRLTQESDLNKFFIQKGLERAMQFSWQKVAEQFLSTL